MEELQVETREGRGGEGLELPAGLAPPRGVVVVQYTFTPAIHGDEDRGEIVVTTWELSLKEERLALKRTKGATDDVAYQYVRLFVRAVGDDVVDWKTAAGDRLVDALLDDLGAKGRNLLMNAYQRQCMPTPEESDGFFATARAGTAG